MKALNAVRPARKQLASVKKPTGPSVFICYSKRDHRIAQGINDRLALAGADPWLDKEKLGLGDDWAAEINEAVRNADAFVVCLRPGFDEAGFRQKELRWAIDAAQQRPPGRGFIIPFVIKPCKLPKWCTPYHAGSDLRKPSAFEDLLRAVEKHCERSLDRSAERAHLVAQVQVTRTQVYLDIIRKDGSMVLYTKTETLYAPQTR